MAQTFNRRPYLQDGPRKSDVENHTFDNYKFTGFKEDKNFLEIDQYSFEECNNVYVDNDGLLRSRPSIKNSNMFEGAINIFRQNDVYIANYYPEGEYQFKIYYKDDNGEYEHTITGMVLSVTSYGDKVYVFYNTDPEEMLIDDNKILQYDKSDDSIQDALIYIPETEVQANSDATKAEPKNALTEKTKKIYFYISSQYSNMLYGKTVVYEAFGETFEFVFNDDTKKTLLREVSQVNQYSDWEWKFANGTFFVYKRIYDDYDAFVRFDMAYSVDGINFVILPSLSYNLNDNIEMFDDGTGFMCEIQDDYLHLYYYSFNSQSLTRYYTFQSNDSFFNNTTYFSGNSKKFIAILYFPYLDSTYRSGYVLYNNGTTVYNEIDHYGPVKLYDGVVNLYGRISSSSGYYVIEDGYTAYTYDTFSGSATPAFSTRLIWNNYESFRDTVLNKNYYSVLRSSGAFDTPQLIIVDILRNSPNGNYVGDKDTVDEIKVCQDGESIYDFSNYQKIDSNPIPLKIPNNLTKILGFYNNSIYGLYEADNNLYIITSYFGINDSVKLTEIIGGDDTIIAPEQIEQLNEYYFRVGNKLYISEYREDDEGNLQWYLPEINIEEFDGFVTMCPLSSTEMGIFTETGIYIVYRSDQQYEMSTGWKYYPYIQIKSKMDVKIRKGSDVLPTYDGTSLIVPTTRGLALMTYQDFVQSTDQKLEFLSDTIYDAFEKYNTREIKLFRYSYWFFVYRLSDNMLFLLDIRNGSWWPMSGNKSLKSFILYNDKPLLLANNEKTYVFDKSVDNYKDDDGFIDWYLRSQKLYLGAANYYKHIQNLTFMSHLLGDNDDGYTFKCYLRNTAYRSRISSDAKGKMWEYDIEMIRSYVLRLNYPKVCEFQYELRMNKENTTVDFTPVPLSLSNITVKYRMGGQIR